MEIHHRRSCSSSPAVGADGTIYVGSDDGNLYAVNPDGSQKWKWFETSFPYSVRSSPAVGADGTIYVGSDVVLYAVNLDGSQKWKFELDFYRLFCIFLGGGC